MTRRPLVAVVGSGTLPGGDPRLDLAEELGTALVQGGYRVLCGGRGGVMEAAARGARAAPNWRDGDVIGVLPGPDGADANPFVDIVLPTGLGSLRNGIVARADAVVAVGGGAGTLSEVALAWVFDRPIIAFRTEGWSGRLADLRLDGRRRPGKGPADRVYGVDRPEQVVALLADLLPRTATQTR